MQDWKFRPKAEGEIKEDPIQERFFTTSDVGDLTTALIRESIQNSMDARTNKEQNPAIVRFLLCPKGISPGIYNQYFKDLLEHLKSENNGLEELPDFSREMPFLVIDDYNTTGLEGDIFEEDDPPKDDSNKHNFYWFWRNIARSGKGQDDIGRWGVGKTVFSASSEINTFFGLTVRREDGKKYLMGKSVLKWHQLSENREWFCPYGFFSNYENNSTYFAIPFDSEVDKSIIENFENTFKIQRKNNEDNDYYGLSIAVPFPKKEITRRGIILAGIKQYFYPIIEGKLIVEVESEIDEPLSIKSDNIDKILDSIDFENYTEKNNLQKVFLLVRKSLKLLDEDFISFKKPPLDKPPRWQDSWLYNEDIYSKIDVARTRFENGEIIPFKIPMRILEKGKDPEINWFKTFVQYDGFLNETDSYFIRDGVTITGIKTIKKKGLRILIVIDEKKIARMFGDSENPAHTEFQKDAPHFLKKYIDGAACITFLTNTVSNIYNLLIRPSEGTDDEILKDIFYIEKDSVTPEPKQDLKVEEKGEDYNNKKIEKINGKISPYIVSKAEGGIQVTNNPYSEISPKRISMQIAYMVPKGNPLKKYSAWDFDLNESSFNVETLGGVIEMIKENKIDFKIDNKEFRLKITGFDYERDLFVKVLKNDKEI